MKLPIHVGRGGFSLVEFMVVLVVLGLLTALAYPRLAALAPIYRLDGVARNLAIDLQKARGRAIAEGKCFQVVFNVSAKTYQLQSFTCGTTSFSNEGDATPISDSGTISIENPLDEAGSAPPNPAFDSRGRATTVSSIKLLDSSNGARIVFVQSTGVYVH